jgi:hypothetical protein
MFLLAVIIICVAAIIIAISYNKTKTLSPQFNCFHEMETIKTWNGERSNEYLSTCKKCGHQQTHHFRGTN